jgi:tungstate transport system ATP-binding protein
VTWYILEKITKNYGEIKALMGIDLEISDELLGIIGDSGVGKTTLLKILAGLENPTSGFIKYNDMEIIDSNSHLLRKNVTMIFQTPKFLRGDVYTNVAYGLKLRKTHEPTIKQKVDEALEAVRLSGFDARNAKNLSGGEQQRLALARALVLNPDVLLLDEPTSNLDPGNASIINDILSEESSRRVIVIATHDLSQITRLADRVLFLKNGIISEEGSPEQIEAMTRFTENIFTGVSTPYDGIQMIKVDDVVINFTEKAEGRITIHVRPQQSM